MIFIPYVYIAMRALLRASGICVPGAGRLVAAARHRSPPWLLRATDWVLGPNIGILLHLNGLRHMFLMAFGFFPTLSANDEVLRRNAKRWTLSLMKMTLIAFEPYDLRASIIVFAFLDVPIWAAMNHRTLGMPTQDAVMLAILNGSLCIGVQAVNAYRRQTLLATMGGNRRTTGWSRKASVAQDPYHSDSASSSCKFKQA